jgi:hypothetical protein
MQSLKFALGCLLPHGALLSIYFLIICILVHKVTVILIHPLVYPEATDLQSITEVQV